MIFLTVGSMMPFDRLVSAVDGWAETRGRRDVFAQIGSGIYVPHACEWVRKLSSAEFGDVLSRASLVVAHAGMGTVLKAMEAGLPMVLLPRAASLREVTTDHQLNAVTWLSKKPGVRVVIEADELASALDNALESLASPGRALPATAPAQFIDRVRALLKGE